jgi:hypothetical protein
MGLRLTTLAVLFLALCLADPAGAPPQFTWEGDVNEFCILKVRRGQAQALEADGSLSPHQHFRFRTKLPDTNQTLRLQMLHGRGVVRFLTQPNLNNDYTATLRIDDPQPGPSHYSIALSWQESSYDEPNPRKAGRKDESGTARPASSEAMPAQQAVSWAGHVEGTVRVSVRGTSSYSQIVSGELRGEQASILQPLPHRADLKYRVTKVSGGGQVQLIESPSEANGYTLTFEIRNGESPDTEYAVDVGWSSQPAAR